MRMYFDLNLRQLLKIVILIAQSMSSSTLSTVWSFSFCDRFNFFDQNSLVMTNVPSSTYSSIITDNRLSEHRIHFIEYKMFAKLIFWCANCKWNWVLVCFLTILFCFISNDNTNNYLTHLFDLNYRCVD